MVKKTIGILLIIIGLLALVTPFTPGSWLIFVGLGLLGFRMLFWDKIKVWFSTPAGDGSATGGKGGSRQGGQKHDSQKTK